MTTFEHIPSDGGEWATEYAHTASVRPVEEIANYLLWLQREGYEPEVTLPSGARWRIKPEPKIVKRRITVDIEVEEGSYYVFHGLPWDWNDDIAGLRVVEVRNEPR